MDLGVFDAHVLVSITIIDTESVCPIEYALVGGSRVKIDLSSDNCMMSRFLKSRAKFSKWP